MADEQTKEKTCELCLILTRYGGVSSSYDLNGGLKRSFCLRGRIDHPSIGRDSAFHDKRICVEISSPPDTETIEHIRTNYARGVGNLCGGVRVTAGVEPERFELDRGIVEMEPIQAYLYLTPDAFEAIRRQAVEAYDHSCTIAATINLVGDALPATIDPNSLMPMSVPMKDLDISADKVYGVRGLEIHDSLYFTHLQGRVLEVKRGLGEGYGANISILLTEARYEVDVELARIHSILCKGRVINGWGKPYDGANVEVKFKEHELNMHGVLPERAIFGEFGYYLKQPDKGYSSTTFTFSLRYVPADLRDILMPLLSQEVGTHVVLAVTLATAEEELLAVTNELLGAVRRYSIEVRRKLINA